ncbi:MAG: hypothetical protein U0V72_09570 [Cytophagales bacterium]
MQNSIVQKNDKKSLNSSSSSQTFMEFQKNSFPISESSFINLKLKNKTEFYDKVKGVFILCLSGLWIWAIFNVPNLNMVVSSMPWMLKSAVIIGPILFGILYLIKGLFKLNNL